MVNKRIKFLLVFLLLALMTGCSQMMGFGGKDFTIEGVIEQAAENMAQKKGTSYEIEGKQEIEVAPSGKKQLRKDTFKMRMDLEQQPFAMQISGEIQSSGIKQPINIYLVKKTLYQQSPDGTWIKSEGIDTNTLEGQVHKPEATLEQLKRVLGNLTPTQKEKLIKMRETEDAYQLEVLLTENEDSALHQLFQGQLKRAISPQINQLGFPSDMDAMKLKEWKQVIWIEKENFNQQKMEQEFQVELLVNELPMKINQKMVQTYLGPYNKGISVPASVKRSAK